MRHKNFSFRVFLVSLITLFLGYVSYQTNLFSQPVFSQTSSVITENISTSKTPPFSEEPLSSENISLPEKNILESSKHPTSTDSTEDSSDSAQNLFPDSPSISEEKTERNIPSDFSPSAENTPVSEITPGSENIPESKNTSDSKNILESGTSKFSTGFPEQQTKESTTERILEEETEKKYPDSEKDAQEKEEIEIISEEEIPKDKLPKPVVTPVIEPTIHEIKKSEPEHQNEKNPSVPKEKEKTPEEKPVDTALFHAQQHMTSPRATVNFILDCARKQDYTSGVFTLDLSKLPEISQGEKENLVYKLNSILIRLNKFSPDRIPEEEFHGAKYYLWPDKNFNAILLEQQKNKTWKFSADSVADISRMYDAIKDQRPVFNQKSWMRQFPSWLLIRIGGLLYIQWIFIGIFIFLGFLTIKILPVITSYLVLFPLQSLRKDDTFIHLTRRAIRPLAYLAMLYIWYLGFWYVQLPPQVLKIIGWIIHPVGIFLIMVTVLRVTDILGQWIKDRMQRAQNKIGNALADLMTNSLKVLFVCIGIICVAQVYGFSALGILSGMGIGGIAVALAAQNTVANFFGSLMILMDRPFTVGDYITTDKIEGVIETIGLRSTRIRTFYNSLIVIPNSNLASAVIDNMERRYFRRYRTLLNIQYGTPVEKLETFCSRINDLILSYENVKKTGVQVYVSELASYSVDVLVCCHFAASSVTEEYESKQKLILGILRIAEEMGIIFASPGDRQVVMLRSPDENT
ncbi:MAG: mechanosensitive ion channel [Planctomycetia bacterium]|nr:mechanosensitive ion channel [Planctomycetia bacterium]